MKTEGDNLKAEIEKKQDELHEIESEINNLEAEKYDLEHDLAALEMRLHDWEDENKTEEEWEAEREERHQLDLIRNKYGVEKVPSIADYWERA